MINSRHREQAAPPAPDVHVQFREQAGHVGLHCCHAHEEFRRGLGVGYASSDGQRNVTLSVAECRESRLGVGSPIGAVVGIQGGDLTDESTGAWGARIGSPLATRRTASTMSAGGVSLSRPARSRPECPLDILVSIERREDHDLRGGVASTQQLRLRLATFGALPEDQFPELRRLAGPLAAPTTDDDFHTGLRWLLDRISAVQAD
jgi:hypothetical protein